MGKLTSHYTPRQREALLTEAHCKRQARLAEQHWMKAAPYFAKMLREELFAELDFPNFSTWCESIGVSSSHAYSLAGIDDLPIDTKNSLQVKKVGLGKIKLVLKPLADAVENQDDDRVDELVDMAGRMTWNDLRQELNGNDPAPRWVILECPRCHRDLRASRAVLLEPK